MADLIDDLKVQIEASTQNADAKLDKFIAKMMKLQSTITGLEMSNVSNIASGINQISASIQNFNSRIKTTDFTRVTTGLNKLAAVDAQGLSNTSRAMSTFASNMASLDSINYNPDKLVSIVKGITRLGGANATQAVQNLPQISSLLRNFITEMNTVGSVTFNFDGLESLVTNITKLGGVKATQSVKNLKPIKDQLLKFVSGLNGIGALNFDTTNLTNLVTSITKLGGKAATNAIPNIRELSIALKDMMRTLSSAPAVSKNLIQMTNALANLAGKGSRVNSASAAMYKGLGLYGLGANKATKHTKGLASQIGMFYAKCFMAIRGIKALGKATASSMDYIETLNYFDKAWEQVAQNAVGNWKDSGYKSAEEYAKSFSQRALELTGKMSGFTPDENGNLVSTGMPSLGLDPEMTMNYQATFGQMASSMGVASETALKLSQALTEIGADLASVKNMKFEDVWNDMASGMVGMSRTLDKYGVNIRNVNLQQKLSELGINANIMALNQQDKALLRTIILLESTKYAWGDMASTIGQPANQLRLLQANFANLARTIGSLFLPVVSKVLPYINALVIALQRLFSWIGGLLGIKIGGFSSSVGSAATDFGDIEDAAGGIADSTGAAAKNTKKMADNLQGFDKLNIIKSQDEPSGGGGAGGGGGTGGLLDDAFLDAFSEYQKAWDTAFSNMENSAKNMADNIENAFKRIWEIAEPTREALKRLWNEGLSQFGKFTWTALKDFYNEFLVPVGKWTLGTGLPMLVDNINAFLMKIDFPAINEALRNFWQALTPFATKVGEGLIEFFGDLLSVGADFINFTVPNGINSVAEALRNIDPDTAEKIGYALGIVAAGIMGFKTLNVAISNIKKLYSPVSKLFGLVGPMKYVAIAGGIAGLVIALDKFGIIKVNWTSLTNGFKNLASALGKFVKGIGEGLISFIEGITPIISPALETAVNGIGGAFSFFAKVLNSIPESVIAGFTASLISFFVAWKTYQGINTAINGVRLAIDGFKTAYTAFGLAVLQTQKTKSLLEGLAYVFGPSALGGIAFTAIAGGLLSIAVQMMRITDESAKTSAIGQFSQAIGELSDEIEQKTDTINNSINNTKTAVETAGAAETQAAKDLASEYEKLSEKANLTATDKDKLREISSQLVDIIPNLSQYINEETGYLDIQKESLDAVIQGYESLAQKQAAQESLVQAYKDQYAAQMNVKNATDGYNKAFNEYLASAGLAPDIIKQLRDNQLDLNQAQKDFENSPNAFQEKYGVINMKALKDAVKGLSKEMDSYNIALDDAYKAQSNADSNLSILKNTIEEADEKLKVATESEKAAKLVSDEYKQSLSDLTTEFSNMGLALSEDFLKNLALNDFDPAALEGFFDSLQKGVQASGGDLQNAFKELGLSLPKELSNAISQLEPETQAEVSKMLMQIQSGAEIKAPELKELFGHLGYDLPDSIANNMASKEGTVQTATINLLSKIENGHKLTEGKLVELFSGLGLKITDEGIIKSLAEKEPEVQAQAIELLSQISAVEESERPELVKKLESLGVDSADSLGKGIESEQNSVTTQTSTFVEAVKSVATSALNINDKSDGSMYSAGANASKGFWQGLKDNWDDSWMGRKINELKETITGRQGLDEHSPSKILGQYGAFAGLGFNNEFQSEMDKTIPMVEIWMRSIKSTLSGYKIAFPGSDFTYSFGIDFLNQYEKRPQISLPEFNASSMSIDYTAELTASLKGSNEELLYELKRNNDLLEQLVNKPIIDETGIYNATRNGVAKHFRQTGKTGFKGIDS